MRGKRLVGFSDEVWFDGFNYFDDFLEIFDLVGIFVFL